MEFTIKREPFLRELALLRDVASAKSINPILACVRIEAEAEEDELFLAASDGSVSLSSICRAADTGLNIAQGGVAIVDAKRFHTYISAMESTEVVCATDETGWMQLWYPDRRDGKPLYRMPGFPADDFPAIPEPPESEDFKTGELPAHALASMTAAVESVIPNTQETYSLPGVMLRFDKDAVRMVATDSHRLLVAARKGETEDPWELPIPKKAILTIAQACRAVFSGRVAITRGRNHVFADVGGRTIASALLAGDFPPWGNIIKSMKVSKFAALDTKKFKNAAARVAAVHDSRGVGGIQLSFLSSGVLRFNAQTSLWGEADEEMEIGYKVDEKVADKDLTVRVNHNYLLGFLGSAQADTMKVAGSDPLAPIKLIDGDLQQDGFQTDCIIMVLNPNVIAQEAEIAKQAKAAKASTTEAVATPSEEEPKPRGARRARKKNPEK